jgi:hypothetical protein
MAAWNSGGETSSDIHLRKGKLATVKYEGWRPDLPKQIGNIKLICCIQGRQEYTGCYAFPHERREPPRICGS